jgi:hypothetical protein
MTTGDRRFIAELTKAIETLDNMPQSPQVSESCDILKKAMRRVNPKSHVFFPKQILKISTVSDGTYKYYEVDEIIATLESSLIISDTYAHLASEIYNAIEILQF